MRNTVLSILGFLVSCEEKECCVSPEIELWGKFSHEITNCDNSSNSEVNCMGWFEFLDAKEVNIVYGGSDIVHRFEYEQKENILHLEGPPSSSFKPSFEITDANTLIRLDNQEVWKKTE